MVNQQVKVGVANNDKRAKCWCGTGKVGVATSTPAIRAFSTHAYKSTVAQGRIQENSKGRVMNRSGAPTYTQN